jgi:hypothetical protein
MATDNPFDADFTGEQTVHLGMGGMTIWALEKIVEVGNKHGKVAIVGFGNTSLTQLFVDLVGIAEKLKAAKKMIEEVQNASARDKS